MEIRSDSYKFAIKCHPSFGPIFGDNDICICDNSNASNDSSSKLKSYDSRNDYEYFGGINPEEYLAGAKNFKVSEMEVFKI